MTDRIIKTASSLFDTKAKIALPVGAIIFLMGLAVFASREHERVASHDVRITALESYIRKMLEDEWLPPTAVGRFKALETQQASLLLELQALRSHLGYRLPEASRQ